MLRVLHDGDPTPDCRAGGTGAAGTRGGRPASRRTTRTRSALSPRHDLGHSSDSRWTTVAATKAEAARKPMTRGMRRSHVTMNTLGSTTSAQAATKTYGAGSVPAYATANVPRSAART